LHYSYGWADLSFGGYAVSLYRHVRHAKDETMLITDLTSRTDAPEDGLPAGHAFPDATLIAVRRVLALEAEVKRLRDVSAAMPAAARQDPAWQDKVAHLLSRVALFRLAVSDQHGHAHVDPSSARAVDRAVD